MKSALKLCTKANGDLLLTLAKVPNNPHYGENCVLIWQMNNIQRIDLVSTIHVITMRSAYCDVFSSKIEKIGLKRTCGNRGCAEIFDL